MTRPEGGAYDPETVKFLWEVLDDAWDRLSPEQQARTQKSDVGLRVLLLALRGERDPVKLWMGAVTDIIAADNPLAIVDFLKPALAKRPAAPSARPAVKSGGGRRPKIGRSVR